MNSKKLFLIFLSVIFATSTLFASAESARGNVSCSEIIPQQAWYTKLIKLENLKSKDVNGTLNFDLVPDNSANKKYIKSNEIDEITKEPSTVDVVPGLVNHSYKVPFSSNDYVDKNSTSLLGHSGVIASRIMLCSTMHFSTNGVGLKPQLIHQAFLSAN